MPSFTCQVPNMRQVGPIIELFIGPSKLLQKAMAQQGKPPINPVKVVGMVDTGASGTVVIPSVLKELGLHPIGATRMNTPSTKKAITVPQYNVGLVFPNGVALESVIALESPPGGQPIQCLIGRDILKHGVLTYIGYINQFTLSF